MRAFLIVICLLMSNSAEADLILVRNDLKEVHRHDDNGQFIDVVVAAGTSPLESPRRVKLGPDGCLYVSDNTNLTVYKYSYPAGNYLGVFTSGIQISEIRSMDFGADGNLYALDGSSIRVFDGSTGVFLATLFTDPTNSLIKMSFVPNTTDVIFTGFNPGNELRRGHIDMENLTYTPVYSRNFSNSNSPRGFAIGPGNGVEGDLYISTEFNRIERHDVLFGGFQMVHSYAAIHANDVEIGPDGHLYISFLQYDGFRIYRFDGETGLYIDIFVDALPGASIQDIEFVANLSVVGDVNRDGNVDLLDVQPFVECLSNGHCQFEADANQDGAVDLLDVAVFVALLSA